MQMKSLKIITVSLVAIIAYPASAAEYDEATVKAECSKKWGTEYDMVKYCIDQRADGFTKFVEIKNLIPHEQKSFFQPTIAHCERKWRQEWDMTAYCLQENVSAMANIPTILAPTPDDIGSQIFRECAAKWDAQLDMIAYCAEQRVDGWVAINN